MDPGLELGTLGLRTINNVIIFNFPKTNNKGKGVKILNERAICIFLALRD
jgi:hypothetical protein